MPSPVDTPAVASNATAAANEPPPSPPGASPRPSPRAELNYSPTSDNRRVRGHDGTSTGTSPTKKASKNRVTIDSKRKVGSPRRMFRTSPGGDLDASSPSGVLDDILPPPTARNVAASSMLLAATHNARGKQRHTKKASKVPKSKSSVQTKRPNGGTKSTAKKTGKVQQRKTKANSIATNLSACINLDFHRWARPSVFDSDTPINISDAAFATFSNNFDEQIRHRFKEERVSKRQKEAVMGLGLRSSQDADLLVDADAASLETTDVRRLSRHQFEDILGTKAGEPVLLYFLKDSADALAHLSGRHTEAAKQQRIAKIGGISVRMNKQAWVCIKATFESNALHADIQSGQMSMAQLESTFKGKQGFTISFTGTNDSDGNTPIRLTFPWSDVCNRFGGAYYVLWSTQKRLP